MRPLVAPPPTLRCSHCGGELRLKQVELADREFGRQSEIFVCVSCGREQTFTVSAEPYAAPATYRSPPRR
jgi:DNA-directed RNA polymerase subunit RPC12/RpoP